MRPQVNNIFWTVVVLLLLTTSYSAQEESKKSPDKNASASVEPTVDEQPIVTLHQTNLGTRVLRYTATTGLLPIRNNETGDVHGNIFFVTYSLDRTPGEAKRPLMFLWNGGPGANSTLVHLSGFGPMRIKSNDDPTAPPECECELEDNQTTWLDLADLVFVDPV